MRLRGAWHCGRLEWAWESLPARRPFDWVEGSHEIIVRLRGAIPGKPGSRSEGPGLGRPAPRTDRHLLNIILFLLTFISLYTIINIDVEENESL